MITGSITDLSNIPVQMCLIVLQVWKGRHNCQPQLLHHHCADGCDAAAQGCQGQPHGGQHLPGKRSCLLQHCRSIRVALNTSCKRRTDSFRLLNIYLTPQNLLCCLQAASGAGQAAMDELELQTRESLEGKPITTNIFPFQVGHGCCLCEVLLQGQPQTFICRCWDKI